MVLLVIADPIPAVVFWGDNNTCIYNEAYTELIGSKHPAMQGGDPAVELAEVWDYYDSMLATQRETFLTVQDKNIQLFLKRRGFLEETYFTYKFVPIIGAEGYVVGSHVSVVETTHEVISSRRLATVNALKEGISSAKDIHALWCKIIKGLEHAQYDIPLVMLYSIAGVSDASITSSAAAISNVHTGSIECTLEGSIGIPEGHPVAPKTFALDQNKTWLADACRIGLRGAACVLLQVEDGSLPSDVVQGITWRGFGEPSTKFVVCPIHSTYSEEAVAFLVIALNPKRPFDEEYQDFLKTLTMQITTPQVSSVLLGAEVWKRQALARQESEDRAEISQESLMPAMEFDKFETRFARFAERAQVGLVISDAYGQILYANGLWREMAQLETGEGKEAWARGILAADLDFVYRMFDQIVRDGAPASFQFHLKTPWRSAGFNKDGKHAYAPTCVLCSSYPDKDENGIVTTVMSVLTNISELKWIEAQLRTRTAEVEQRELMWRNFTDRAPIGLCLIKAKGLLEFGNETWWSMTATPKGETSGLAWIEKEVIPKHVPKVKQMFEDALEKDYKQATPATMEFCLNRFWEGSERQHQPSETAKNGETRRTTILCTVHTTYNVDYTVRHVVGWLTDITAQKAAEAVLQKRMDQAIEMKKQQERFIDVSSMSSSTRRLLT
jgi:PAS domain-containing protein